MILENRRLNPSDTQKLNELKKEKKQLENKISSLDCVILCFSIVIGFGFSIITGIVIGVKMNYIESCNITLY